MSESTPSNPNGNSDGAINSAPSAASLTPYPRIPPTPQELIGWNAMLSYITDGKEAELMATSIADHKGTHDIQATLDSLDMRHNRSEFIAPCMRKASGTE